MVFDIRGKVILVTGANRGIGRVLVETFLDHGAAKVYAAVRDTASTAPLIRQYGDRVVTLQVDMEDPESIAASAKAAPDVDVVVSNAGVLTKFSPLDPGAIDALQFEMNVNVYGLIRLAQAFAPVLDANGGGVFVQINSTASIKCVPDFATYCASKAAAYSITQALRAKLGRQGTRIISVHPGPIDTDMAVTAGITEWAEPPSVVADAIIDAVQSGSFHVFPDALARRLGEAYKGFAEDVVETSYSEL